MIHQYKLSGYNIVLDVYSGSVHAVDDVAYDAIALIDQGLTREAATAQLEQKYRDRADVTPADISDCFDDIEELTAAGQLFAPDAYADHAFDFKNRSNVVKALCLHVAHTCNLNCEYCFASQGKYQGERALMSFEVGKQALDFLIQNSGSRVNLEVDFFGGEPLMNWQVVKDLVESEFQQQYNVPISINLAVGGVVEATLADKGPDVALFLGGEFPVNLAARGLLADVSQMDGYDEMTRLYQDTAMVPYQYEGGTYGLPLTRSWAMMFYRKDVLSELGFTQAPQTWEELIDMLPALQRSYMSAGLVLPAVAADANQATISAATESGLTFASLLLQRGQNYYNSAQTKTTFDTNAAIDAFEMWTDFYTKYDFDQQYDAFSRFRTGEYPIVVSDYCTFFNQLAVAAPEIDGLWGFAPIPGTLQEDGTISHAVNSNNTGAVIFNKVDKKTNGMDNAWTFLKWFCSTEVQVEYGTQIEGLLGQMGRYATANTEALTQLAWSTDEANTILGAMDELEEIPIIPASYSVTRNVMNAFRDVVNNNENPRDTLMSYNRDINEEITRKRENLGLDS